MQNINFQVLGIIYIQNSLSLFNENFFIHFMQEKDSLI